MNSPWHKEINSRKVLVVDDDLSWVDKFRSIIGEYIVPASNLMDGLGKIESEQELTAGIFDRVLAPVPDSISSDSLPVPVRNAGFVLSAAFHQKFPYRRTVVCSLAELHGTPASMYFDELANQQYFKYVNKGDADAVGSIVNFIFAQPHTEPVARSFIDYLILQPNAFGIGIDLKTLFERIRRLSR